ATQPGGHYSLIGAFAPETKLKRLAGQRFSRLGESRCPESEIDVGGTDDANARLAFCHWAPVVVSSLLSLCFFQVQFQRKILKEWDDKFKLAGYQDFSFGGVPWSCTGTGLPLDPWTIATRSLPPKGVGKANSSPNPKPQRPPAKTLY